MALPAKRTDLKASAKRLRVDLEARHRRRLRERLRIGHIAKRRAVARIRAWARGMRRAITERARAARRACRERIRAAADRERAAVKARKELLFRNVRRRFGAALAERRRRLTEDIRLARLMRQREQKRLRGPSLAERRAESDDAVRRNLPPELVPVFDRVRRSIKAGSRRTRTEAFLEWAEEHPAEVLAIQAEHVGSDVERMVTEQHEKERAKVRSYSLAHGRVTAVWRGREFDLATKPLAVERRGDVRVDHHELTVTGPGKQQRKWEVTREADDWELGSQLSGQRSDRERKLAQAWVDGLDGLRSLDDLRDVTPVPF
jgi:hypothetical protein